ncbi:MAG: shikimate dehydrogenase [Polaromonas sp.]|jgi:shikimate dehydrogenase|nr:shikimate dehydrogenase [Polaromonas sp.]
MDHYCVVGNPVAHSKSPQIHARFAELTGQAMSYDKQLVALDGFAEALGGFRQRGVKGCNVTVPFKFEAFACATSRSSRAELAQAANTLRFDADGIHADNTDGIGLVNDIQTNAGVALAGRDILLIGAGGAAAGVLGPLISAKPRRVVVANRTLQKAQALVLQHRAHPATIELLLNTELLPQSLQGVEGDFDVIINATASSLAGAAIPVQARVLKPGALAYDMMYGPAAQAFLSWARTHGAQGRDGLGMLVEQAAAAFEVWRQVRPPSAQVLGEMRAAIQLPGL